MEINVTQRFASVECLGGDAVDTFWNGNVSQTGAAVESQLLSDLFLIRELPQRLLKNWRLPDMLTS